MEMIYGINYNVISLSWTIQNSLWFPLSTNTFPDWFIVGLGLLIE